MVAMSKVWKLPFGCLFFWLRGLNFLIVYLGVMSQINEGCVLLVPIFFTIASCHGFSAFNLFFSLSGALGWWWHTIVTVQTVVVRFLFANCIDSFNLQKNSPNHKFQLLVSNLFPIEGKMNNEGSSKWNKRIKKVTSSNWNALMEIQTRNWR